MSAMRKNNGDLKLEVDKQESKVPGTAFLHFLMLILLFFTAVVVTAAGGDRSPCADMLRAALTKFSAPPGGDSVCSIECTVTTSMRDSSAKRRSTSKFAMTLNKKTMKFISDEMEVFQDSIIALTIIPKSKVVYEGEPNPRIFEARKLQSMAFVRDSLLSSGSITECRESGSGTKLVTFVLDEKGARRFGIARIEYWIDGRQATLKRMRVTYTPVYEAASVDYLFSRMEYEKGIGGNARGNVFAENGRLLPKYSGYRIIDNRKHRNQ